MAWTLALLSSSGVFGSGLPEAPPGAGPALAVLPFGNFTRTSEAADTILPLIYAELEMRQVACIPHRDLRPLLREHRIRSTGMIGETEARLIGEATGVTHLLLGSLDIYEPKEDPEVAISLRLVRIQELAVTAAASAAAAGQDYAGLFGIGRVERIQDVARRVVAAAFDDLEASAVRRARVSPAAEGGRNGALRVALVPLDNLSENLYAGRIMTHMLLSELVNCGYRVVEPGEVNDVCLRHHSVARGGIGRPLLEGLSQALEIDLVITGVVAVFTPARGSLEEAVPEIDFGIRAIDAGTGRILASYDRAQSGADSETLLRRGRYVSLGRLARELLRDLMEQMDEDLRDGRAAISAR